MKTAQAQLEHRRNACLDPKVPRRLVKPSCPYQGSAPTTALGAVQSYGCSLGQMLIIKVGYNESPTGYTRGGIDQVMRTALADGTTGVLWVTLREQSDIYHCTNVGFHRATKCWLQLVVAEQRRRSEGLRFAPEQGDESGQCLAGPRLDPDARLVVGTGRAKVDDGDLAAVREHPARGGARPGTPAGWSRSRRSGRTGRSPTMPPGAREGAARRRGRPLASGSGRNRGRSELNQEWRQTNRSHSQQLL